MKILKAETMAEQENLLAATMQEHVSQGKTFSLEFSGWGFDSYHSGEEFIITLNDEPIFQGYLDSVRQRNSDGFETTEMTVLDSIAQMQKIASMLQEEEVEIEGSGTSVSKGVNRKTSVATRVGSSLGNKVMAVEGKQYTIKVASAVSNYSYVKRTKRVYSMLSQLQSIRSAHPDLSISVNEATKEINIDSTRSAETLELNTDLIPLQIESVEPDFASVCNGVLVTVPYGTEKKLDRVVYSLPASASIHEPGVKVIRTAPGVLSYAVMQAYQYHSVASKLYYNCSVSLPMEKAEGNYLGKNLALTGPGTNPEWNGMLAPVSSVTWDFITRTVTIETQNAVSEPDIPDDPDTPSNDDFSGDGGGGFDPDPGIDPDRSSDESSESGYSLSSGDFSTEFLEPTDFEPLYSRGTFWLTLHWTASKPCTYTLLVDDGEMPFLYNLEEKTSMKLELGYGAYTFTLTATTKGDNPQEAMDVGTYKYMGPSMPSKSKSEKPTPGKSSSGKPNPGKSSNGTPRSDSAQRSDSKHQYAPCSCSHPCSELAALKEKVTALEARVKQLEEQKCDCNAIMAQISEAIDEAIKHVQVEVQVDGVLEHNEIGKLKFNTNGSY